MKDTSQKYAPCAICKSRSADKTNSHIIPSFFVAMVSSIDHSYKRDKELLYTIGDRNTTAYIGRSVREEELINSFDFMSDERLSEMSKQTISKDYIFCSHCEKKLGDYLETPWHNHIFNGSSISSDAAYFFWISLLWRISAYEGITLKLPNHIEKALGKRLNSFIQAKDNKEDTKPLLNKAPFRYKVLYCKDYSKQHAGLIYYEYDHKNKIATMLLGDVAACFSFNKHGSFERQSFYGLEKAFANAPTNDGIGNEIVLNIDATILDATISNLLETIQDIRLKSDRKNILEMWKLVREKLIPLPPKPVDNFVNFVIHELYNDSVKTGEKITHEYFAKCFGLGLEKIYGLNIIHH